MPTLLPLLAHIGLPENPWIGVVTVASWVLIVVVVLVMAGRVTVAAPGDLLLPLAAVVLVAGLTGSLGDVINDQGPWSAPVGLVVLGALLWAAFGNLDLRWGNRGPFMMLGAAVVAVAVLYVPLDNLWFPDDFEPLPELGDGSVTAQIVEPLDDDGRIVVRLTLDGATFGDNVLAERPDDPEDGLTPRFQVGPVYLTPPIPADCAADDACTTADFELTLPASFSNDPEASIVAELLTADGLPFSPPLQTRFSVQ